MNLITTVSDYYRKCLPDLFWPLINNFDSSSPRFCSGLLDTRRKLIELSDAEPLVWDSRKSEHGKVVVGLEDHVHKFYQSDDWKNPTLREFEPDLLSFLETKVSGGLKDLKNHSADYSGLPEDDNLLREILTLVCYTSLRPIIQPGVAKEVKSTARKLWRKSLVAEPKVELDIKDFGIYNRVVTGQRYVKYRTILGPKTSQTWSRYESITEVYWPHFEPEYSEKKVGTNHERMEEETRRCTSEKLEDLSSMVWEMALKAGLEKAKERLAQMDIPKLVASIFGGTHSNYLFQLNPPTFDRQEYTVQQYMTIFLPCYALLAIPSRELRKKDDEGDRLCGKLSNLPNMKTARELDFFRDWDDPKTEQGKIIKSLVGYAAKRIVALTPKPEYHPPEYWEKSPRLSNGFLLRAYDVATNRLERFANDCYYRLNRYCPSLPDSGKELFVNLTILRSLETIQEELTSLAADANIFNDRKFYDPRGIDDFISTEIGSLVEEKHPEFYRVIEDCMRQCNFYPS